MNKNLLTLFSFILLSASVNAEVLFSESFDAKTVGRLAKSGGDWGSGANLPQDGFWHTTGNLKETYIQVVSQQLTKAGYCSKETGKAVRYSGNHGRDYVRFSDDYTLKSGDKIYMAFLLKVNTLTSNANTQIIAGLANSITYNTVGYIYNQVKIKRVDASSYNLAIGKKSETEQVATDVTLSTGTTYLVVTEYIVKDGVYSTASDQSTVDSVNLYINPTKASKEVTKSAKVDLSTSRTDALSFVGVALCTTSYSPTDMVIDELKVTTSWDELWEEGGDTPPQPVVPVPEPAASDKTINSASISWDAVEGADSYVLQWKVNGGSYSSDIAIDKDVRSYDLSDLDENTKYYVRVKTIIGEDASEWAEINFNTSSEPDMLVYKGISFEKYSTQNAMPTSGTYYLAKNVVEYGSGDPLTTTLTNNLTLNLHGKQLFLYGGHIVVPSGVTLTIYDDAGTGEITGGYAGSFVDRGIISVKEGGTLIIGEGAVINLDDESEQVAIHNLGTLKLSGAPVISGNKTDIYLGSVITIESGKPLTNETPYKVYKATGSSFTSGWANMSGESPKDYFYSTNVSNRGICLNASGEAQIVPALNLSESSNNTSIASNENQLVNVNLTRSLTSSQFNTFCLPFALDDDQLQEFFGAGYDLEEFVSSSLEGDVLNLVFNKVTSLEAGKPYLLQPSVNVANPSFEGVTIAATEPVDQTSDANISFHATFAPTELEGGNKNLLFLGAENELFYPASTANIKAFRAYFELKGAAVNSAPKARIVKKQDSATGIENQMVNGKCGNHKFLKDGQLLILRDNKTYNVIGQMVK